MSKVINLYTPHPKQLEIHQSPARFKVANFGRRGGKSTTAQNYILHPGPKNAGMDWPIKGALQDPGRYWIIAPTYTQAKSIYWRGLMFSKDPHDTTAIPKELIAKRNESELIITLVNGSTIELKGADNPDSLRGAGIKGAVLDEYAFWTDPTAWEYVIQPALSDNGGWALFISTPNGFNHFYEMAQHAQNTEGWSYHKATIWDNPNIADDEKKRLEAEIDPDTWAQEYLGEFRKMKGLVYPEFSQDIHVYDPTSASDMQRVFGKTNVPLGGTYALGIDPGTRNALAGVFLFLDYDDNWYLTDELYEREATTERAYRLIKQKMGANYYSIKVADQAAAQFILDMNAIHGLGIEAQKKTRDGIPEGIRLIRQMLKIQELTGKPKFFVSNRCVNFIREIESYRYDEANNREDPIKENDHLMDALRYVKLNTFMPVEKPGTKFKRHYDPDTGRIIGYEAQR